MNLEDEIKEFKEKVKKNYKLNQKNLVYLRLSDLDHNIKPEDRIKDTLDKLEADFLLLVGKYPTLKEKGFKLFVEVRSAYKKGVRRDAFSDLLQNYLFPDIKSVYDILEKEPKENNINLYMSSFDRVSRVFFYSLLFQLLRKLRGINIYTALEEEFLFEQKYKDVVSGTNQDQTFFAFQLMLMSSHYAQHSEDFSNKIKKRITKKGNVTISSKTGAKWGREKSISDSMKKRIKIRLKHFTPKEVSEQADIYQTVKGKRKPIAYNTIRVIGNE